MEYFKIRINSLHPRRPLTFDLYLHLNNHFVLYLREGDALELEKINTFEKKAPDSFYVKEGDRKKYKSYISVQLNDTDLGVRERATILKESTFSLIEEMFENPDLKTALDNAKQAVDDIISFMNSEDAAMSELLGLSSHDFYTYNHSLDVCIYSIGLGQVAGISSPEQLRQLGRGGFFHDIGKRYVPTDIITKKGSLTDEEWETMKLHPGFGLKILENFAETTDEVRACVYEHHENFLGNGYPQNLKGEDIHPLARIVAICDTYDALTTKRSYNEPMSPTQALELMTNKISARFEPALLRAFNETLFKIKK